MPVFKTFMKVMAKRLRVSLIYIVIFITICVVMSATSSENSGFTDSKLSISINDMDNSPASRALTEYISSNHQLVETEHDKDAILDSLYYLETDIALTINEDYSEKLANGEIEGLLSDYRVPGSFAAEFFDSQINRYISVINAYISGGMTVDEAVAKAANIMENEVAVETVSFSESSDASYELEHSMFFQYFAYIIIIVLISALCPPLLTMTSSEIKNRTNCSCIPVTKQMLQLVLGTVIFSVGVYLLLMVSGALMFRSALFNEKGLLAMLNAFVYLIFAMMLTLFISVVSPNPKTVDMIANVFSLGMSFLCGVFVPQYLLSESVLSVGKFLPAYWYVKANNMLSGTNGEIFNMNDYMVCLGIELAFSIALFCVILLVAKNKRSNKSLA